MDSLILFYVGIIIIIGLLFGKLAKALKLPNVTGYLLGGLIFGPVIGMFGWKIVPIETIEKMDIVKQVALGFIAFTIGTEFKISYFKRVGAQPIIIATFESLFAIFAVLFVLLIIPLIFPVEINPRFAIVLSAIAAATAPAATLMVIKQYRAKGEVTENLMSVVALDDATAIIFFGLMVAIANAFVKSDINIGFAIAKPFIEIFGSLLIGFIAGYLISLLLRWYTGRSNRISVIVAFIFIVTSMSVIIKKWFGSIEISTLLACMMMGAVFTNRAPTDDYQVIMELVDRFTPPIFILFFTLSGFELNLKVLTQVGLIGVIYIVFRVVGKVAGSYLGAVISKSSKKVKKYLGWSLIPQAGVAIGLTVVADTIIPEYAPQIKAIILSATLIYELVGPFVTKLSLKKAGEIVQEA
jgi:Kef-type K+ transport system membrane component KefB